MPFPSDAAAAVSPSFSPNQAMAAKRADTALSPSGSRLHVHIPGAAGEALSTAPAFGKLSDTTFPPILPKISHFSLVCRVYNPKATASLALSGVPCE